MSGTVTAMAKCGHSTCGWNKRGGSGLLIFYQDLRLWQEEGHIAEVRSKVKENGEPAGAPRILWRVAVLRWWVGVWESVEPGPVAGCRFTPKALAPAGPRLWLPALLFIMR